MWTFRCTCQSAKKVYVEDVSDVLLPMKLKRYQLTREEYHSLRYRGTVSGSSSSSSSSFKNSSVALSVENIDATKM